MFFGPFLIEQYDIIPITKRRANQGVRFRYLVSHDNSPAKFQCAMQENTSSGLEEYVSMMRSYLSEARPGVDVRAHNVPLRIVYHFEDP